MKFVKKGPDIPEELIDAHQRGEVVFFCGAGISMNNGYPSFQKLYQNLCEYFDFAYDEYLQESSSNEYTPLEIRLNSLANSVQGGITQVKKQVESDFVNVKIDGSLDTQQAILKLSSNKDNCLHLITTNFDSLFSEAAQKIKNKLPLLATEYYPPFLPLSYGTEWNGIVYLHGNFENSSKISNYDSIILTSSDFGRAYLTEGWATNFMKFVFSKYKVCFIGYSLKDQIFSYLMDSISDDDSNDSVKAWIITDTKEDTLKNEDWLYKTKNYWKSKKVEPIFYVVNNYDYSELHGSIIKWAEVYQDDSKFRYETIQKIIHLTYDDSETFIDNLKSICWILLNPSKILLKNLKALNHKKTLKFFLYLQRLCLALRLKQDKIDSSYVQYPQYNEQYSVSENVIANISPYLSKRIINELSIENWFSYKNSSDCNNYTIYKYWTYLYLADEELLFLFQKRRICLNDIDKCWILDAILSRNDSTFSNTNTSRNSKSLLSFEQLKELWHLYIEDLIDVYTPNSSLYDVLNSRDNLSEAETNFLLNNYFRPVLSVIKNDKLIEAKIVFSRATSYYDFKLPSSYKNLPTINNLLFLMTRLDSIADSIPSNCYSRFFDILSISDHRQNIYNSICVHSKFVYFARDCWLELKGQDQDAAKGYLDIWMAQESLYLKRLALFGATVCNKVTPQTILKWLLSDCIIGIDHQNKSKIKVLENVILTREVCHLLKLRGNEFSDNELVQLVSAIFSIKEKRQSKNFRKALLLSRLKKSGANLNQTKFKKKIDYLFSNDYKYLLNDNDRYDFPLYFSSLTQGSHCNQIDPKVENSVEQLKSSLLNSYHEPETIKTILGKSSIEFRNTVKKLYKLDLEDLDLKVARVLFQNVNLLNKDVFVEIYELHKNLIKLTLSQNFADIECYLPKFIEYSIQCGIFEDNTDLFIDLIYSYIDSCKKNCYIIDINDKNFIHNLDSYLINSKLGNLVVHLVNICLIDRNENLSIGVKNKLLNVIEMIFLSTDKNLLEGRLSCIIYWSSLQDLCSEDFKRKLYSLLDVSSEFISDEQKLTWILFIKYSSDSLDLSIPKIEENFLRIYQEFLNRTTEFSFSSKQLAQTILNNCKAYKDQIKNLIQSISVSNLNYLIWELGFYLNKTKSHRNNLSSTFAQNKINQAINNLWIFFDNCWKKSKVDDSDVAVISTNLSKLIIKTDDLFPKFYDSLNIWIEPISPWDFADVLHRLNNKEYVATYPNKVLDLMFQIKSDPILNSSDLSPLVKKLEKHIKGKNSKLEFFQKLVQID